MNQHEMLKLVKSIVIQFVRLRPHLETVRKDLEAEGFIALKDYGPSWDPKHPSGITKAKWDAAVVYQGLHKFVDRQEKRHYRKPPGYTMRDRKRLEDLRELEDLAELKTLEELEYREFGPYWDLEEIPDPDEIIQEDPREDAQRTLMESLHGVELTKREQEFLRLFLELNEIQAVADAMGITKQVTHRHWQSIIKKAQEANDV